MCEPLQHVKLLRKTHVHCLILHKLWVSPTVRLLPTCKQSLLNVQTFCSLTNCTNIIFKKVVPWNCVLGCVLYSSLRRVPNFKEFTLKYPIPDTDVYVFDFVFQPADRGRCWTHRIHGRGVSKWDSLPWRRVEARLWDLYWCGECRALTCKTHSGWFQITCRTKVAIYLFILFLSFSCSYTQLLFSLSFPPDA